MAEIEVQSRDGTRTTVQLHNAPIKVGRSESCDIVLRNDGEVSRVHAQLWLNESERVMVADLSSKNGVRVDNGEVFFNATRSARHRIHIGEHVLEILGTRADTPTRIQFAPDDPQDMAGTRFLPSSRGLDLNQMRLGLLMGLGERLSGTFERKQLLVQALDACCEALGFERGLIVLKTQRGETELPVARNMPRDENGAYKVSRTLINRALVDGERAIVNNAATDLAGNITESMVRFPICSALCVPIRHRDEILGVIYGDRVTRSSTYDAPDVDFFAAIAQQVGVGIANLRLLQEQVQAQHVLAELEHARTIQRVLLPSAPLKLGRLSMEGFNQPSSAVSGDYFDYFQLDAHRAGAIIADVTGHGLPSALLMANLQAAVRVAMTPESKLADLASRVNRLICRNTAADVFITAILATVDYKRGIVEMVNAGHPPPLLLGAETRESTASANSLPLGVEPEDTYKVQRIELGEAVDTVFFFTDGLNEAGATTTDLLGLAPVIKAMSELPRRDTAGVIRTARGVVKTHLGGADHNDDMTFLALHFDSGAQAS